jgi:putative endonuclease
MNGDACRRTGQAAAMNRQHTHRGSRASTLATGAAAEARAAEHVESQGLLIIARNLRCKAGEIDLVGLDGEVLVIIEVRLRARLDFGGASASVTWRKQRKLIRATQYFWQRDAGWRTRALRFDVIAMQPCPDGTEHIVWIKDAFQAG